ncbi:BTB/POZ domain-containing protein KCTD9-like isoform X1 [Panonychus citri]|uniref:BTB/POZ domain-containing protein KCTD9-like isoform X1 n=1 Tax=Panonychus citri TaxID=50023 RepID=UPI002307C2F1|nr:BTB/POZ domain-containing protein KCTD9-like isoform X1 [Panonychus citri]
MKRVIIFRNGAKFDGKVLLVTHSLEDLLKDASAKLNITAKKAFTPQGGEIDDIKLIRDDDILYISSGEPFIQIPDHLLTCNSTNTQYQRNRGFHGNSSPLLVSLPLASGSLLSSISSSSSSSSYQSASSEWISLNIGGKVFSTTKQTLISKEPNSMLSRMFSNDSSLIQPSPRDPSGAYLIDRSPHYFEPILGYLRHGQLILDKNVNPQGILEEAKFYGIASLIPTLEAMVASEEDPAPDVNSLPLTRRDVINALISTSFNSELRFQGVNLAGADLSKLDLRHINFKFANLRGAGLQGANLSYCCLERCDLSSSNMEGVILFGVKMVCANLERASLRAAHMEDPLGKRTNMEGVNLKGAILEGSQMAGVNLRVATLKNANLKNCDLRGACLAGADLENCDLSCSDLHEANLRGANLKGAAFELMPTALHMSQTLCN